MLALVALDKNVFYLLSAFAVMRAVDERRLRQQGPPG